jgi:hypothetical protein
MSAQCKATITFGDVKIVLEGPESFIEQQVEKYSRVPDTSKPESKYLLSDGRSESTGIVLASEREMVSVKQPRGHHEIIAVLAFCLTEKGTTEFGEDEIRRAYIRASVRPPKVISQALRDAKNVHDFLESVERGKYRLSSHGDRTVRFDLPRRGSEA